MWVPRGSRLNSTWVLCGFRLNNTWDPYEQCAILSLFKVTLYFYIEWNLKITVSEIASIQNFLIFLVGTVDGLVCTDYWFWLEKR